MTQIKGLNLHQFAQQWSFYDGVPGGIKDGYLTQTELQTHIDHWVGLEGKVPEEQRQQALAMLQDLRQQIEADGEVVVVKTPETTSTSSTSSVANNANSFEVGGSSGGQAQTPVLTTAAAPEAGSSVFNAMLDMMKVQVEDIIEAHLEDLPTDENPAPEGHQKAISFGFCSEAWDRHRWLHLWGEVWWSERWLCL